MTPRPDDNDLPFFLNGITNRMSYYFSTGKSLKMNSYTNSKLYNLCNELNTQKNKYKNSHLNAVRKSLGFSSENNYDNINIKELDVPFKEAEVENNEGNNIYSNENFKNDASNSINIILHLAYSFII